MKRLAQEYHMVDLVSYHVQVVSCHSLSEHGWYHWTHSLRVQDFLFLPLFWTEPDKMLVRTAETLWGAWDAWHTSPVHMSFWFQHNLLSLVYLLSSVRLLITFFGGQPLLDFMYHQKCKNHQVIYNSLLAYHIQWQIFKTTHYYFLKRKYSKKTWLS